VKKKSENKFRILLFGDSFTAGDGVSNQYRYSDLLPSLLGNSVEVYNFGLSGTGTDQQYLCYREFAKDIEADLLVLGIYVENIRRNVAHYRPFLDNDDVIRYYSKPWYELSDNGSLHLNGVPLSRYPINPSALPYSERATIDRSGRYTQLRSFVRKFGNSPIQIIQRLSRYQPLPNYSSALNYDWRLMHATLNSWINDAPIPILLFPIPIYQYIEKTANSSSMRARFQELANTSSCHLIDPLPDLWLRSKADRRRFRFDNDSHLTKSGHEALVLSLSKRISKLFHL
jgi:carbamoyltransferase